MTGDKVNEAPMAGHVPIMINGQASTVPAGITVRALIQSMGLGNAACAVEVNHRLVPRKEHESRLIQPEDRVEIVSLIGGG